MEEIEIAYNRELKPLEALLSGVKNPGDFSLAVRRRCPYPG